MARIQRSGLQPPQTLPSRRLRLNFHTCTPQTTSDQGCMPLCCIPFIERTHGEWSWPYTTDHAHLRA